MAPNQSKHVVAVMERASTSAASRQQSKQTWKQQSKQPSKQQQWTKQMMNGHTHEYLDEIFSHIVCALSRPTSLPEQVN